MSEIVLSNFESTSESGSCNLTCKVTGFGYGTDRLDFLIEGSDGLDSPPPTADYALAGLIYPAMMAGHDLIIEGHISRSLNFFANGDLQALLSSYRPRLSRIRIDSELAPDPISPNPRCGTGYSAGVDTFATLSLYEDNAAPEKITDLMIFDVGAFGKEQTDAVRNLFARNVRRLVEKAEATERGWFSVKTNLDDFYTPLKKSSFQKTHSIRNASAAMSLQNIVGTYLYSSTYPYNDINSRNDDMAFIEPMLMPLLTSRYMTFISAGSGLSRLEKMRIVANYPPAFDALDVCVAAPHERGENCNCSKCWKCLRAMLTFDALGKLDAFEGCFDIEYYRRHRSEAIRAVAISAAAGKPADRDVRALLDDTDLDEVLPFASYLQIAKARVKNWIKSISK